MANKDPRADVRMASLPHAASPPDGDAIVVSHNVLFIEIDPPRCDACNAILPDDGDDDDGYRIPGHGVYMGRHAGEPRLVSVPLCRSCSCAIGVTALGRWEIEEEDG